MSLPPLGKWFVLALGLWAIFTIMAFAADSDIRIDVKDSNTIRTAWELAMLLQNGDKVHAIPASSENDASCQANLGPDFFAFGFAIDSAGRPHILCTKKVWDRDMAVFICGSLNSVVASFDEANQVLVCAVKPNA